MNKYLTNNIVKTMLTLVWRLYGANRLQVFARKVIYVNMNKKYKMHILLMEERIKTLCALLSNKINYYVGRYLKWYISI